MIGDTILKKIFILFFVLAVSLVGCSSSYYGSNKATTVTQNSSSNTLSTMKDNITKNNYNMNSKEHTTKYLSKSECVLLVNGRVIDHKGCARIDYEKRNAELPLIIVLEALGASVTWETDNKATIIYNNKVYYLDTSNNTIYEHSGRQGNLFTYIAGEKHTMVFKTIDNNYVVDRNSTLLLMDSLNCRCIISFTNATITVENFEYS